LTAARVDEEAAAGCWVRFWRVRRPSENWRGRAVDDGIDGCPGMLAHVDGFAQVSVAGVVFAIAEKQDEVAGRLSGVRLPLIAAGGVERIEDSGQGIEAAG